MNNKKRDGCLAASVLVGLLTVGCHNVREPVSRLDVTDRATSNQLLAGFWWVESGSWRWTAREFSAALKPPAGAELKGSTLQLHLYIPDSQIESLGPMTLTARIDDQSLPPETFSKGGNYIYTREVSKELLATSILPVKFRFDKALPPEKGDGRELAAIVSEIELETN